MDKKLTLKLDGDVIESAKTYAVQHNESVSGMVEKYLKALTENSKNENMIQSKNIISMSGIINIPDKYDEKNDYREYKASKQ